MDNLHSVLCARFAHLVATLDADDNAFESRCFGTLVYGPNVTFRDPKGAAPEPRLPGMMRVRQHITTPSLPNSPLPSAHQALHLAQRRAPILAAADALDDALVDIAIALRAHYDMTNPSTTFYLGWAVSKAEARAGEHHGVAFCTYLANRRVSEVPTYQPLTFEHPLHSILTTQSDAPQ